MVLKSGAYNQEMITLKRPSRDIIGRFLAEQSEQDYSYSEVGATSTTPPKGYTVDHTRGLLGQGKDVFCAAKRALSVWQHFQLGWVTPLYPETPVQEGSVIGILARSYGLYFLNACRVVYLVEEENGLRRFGFAYGTLPEHAETGEERFTIEWSREDDSVWYDILAFSQPNKWYARVAKPIVRAEQKRFARDSVLAMQNAVVKNFGNDEGQAV